MKEDKTMRSIWTGIQIAFSAIGGFIGWLLGGFDGFLYALIAFAVIDYITGVMCAISDKRLSSEVGFKGICRKVLNALSQSIGNLVDVYVLGEAGSPAHCSDLLLSFQRGRIPFGKLRTSGSAYSTKAEIRSGTASQPQ